MATGTTHFCFPLLLALAVYCSGIHAVDNDEPDSGNIAWERKAVSGGSGRGGGIIRKQEGTYSAHSSGGRAAVVRNLNQARARIFAARTVSGDGSTLDNFRDNDLHTAYRLPLQRLSNNQLLLLLRRYGNREQEQRVNQNPNEFSRVQLINHLQRLMLERHQGLRLIRPTLLTNVNVLPGEVVIGEKNEATPTPLPSGPPSPTAHSDGEEGERREQLLSTSKTPTMQRNRVLGVKVEEEEEGKGEEALGDQEATIQQHKLPLTEQLKRKAGSEKKGENGGENGGESSDGGSGFLSETTSALREKYEALRKEFLEKLQILNSLRKRLFARLNLSPGKQEEGKGGGGGGGGEGEQTSPSSSPSPSATTAATPSSELFITETQSVEEQTDRDAAGATVAGVSERENGLDGSSSTSPSHYSSGSTLEEEGEGEEQATAETTTTATTTALPATTSTYQPMNPMKWHVREQQQQQQQPVRHETSARVVAVAKGNSEATISPLGTSPPPPPPPPTSNPTEQEGIGNIFVTKSGEEAIWTTDREEESMSSAAPTRVEVDQEHLTTVDFPSPPPSSLSPTTPHLLDNNQLVTMDDSSSLQPDSTPSAAGTLEITPTTTPISSSQENREESWPSGKKPSGSRLIKKLMGILQAKLHHQAVGGGSSGGGGGGGANSTDQSTLATVLPAPLSTGHLTVEKTITRPIPRAHPAPKIFSSTNQGVIHEVEEEEKEEEKRSEESGDDSTTFTMSEGGLRDGAVHISSPPQTPPVEEVNSEQPRGEIISDSLVMLDGNTREKSGLKFAMKRVGNLDNNKAADSSGIVNALVSDLRQEFEAEKGQGQQQQQQRAPKLLDNEEEVEEEGKRQNGNLDPKGLEEFAEAEDEEAVCDAVACDFEQGDLCQWEASKDELQPTDRHFFYAYMSRRAKREEGNGAAAAAAATTALVTRTWHNWEGRYRNRLTGIARAQVFSQLNRRFAAAYVQAHQQATLSADLLSGEEESVRFRAWEATRDVQLKVCCDNTNNCVFETDRGVRRGSRRWKEYIATCPKGTRKVIFQCLNSGVYQGACGVDNVHLLNQNCPAVIPIVGLHQNRKLHRLRRQ